MNAEEQLKATLARLQIAIHVGHSLSAEFRHFFELGQFSPQYLEQFTSFRSSGLSVLVRIFGEDHHHTLDFKRHTEEALDQSPALGLGVLQTARDDIEAGWLQTMRQLVSADLFSDFLEMAEYLLKEAYKDAAAVIIGSTLEEHLRSLCTNRSIPLQETVPHARPKSAARLNDDLAKASAYNKGHQKQVTAWLDIRNNAAHGHYREYTKEQVQNMLDGVRNFLTRVPQ